MSNNIRDENKMKSVTRIKLNVIVGIILATVFVLGLSTIDSAQNFENNIQLTSPIEDAAPKFGDSNERAPEMEIALSEKQFSVNQNISTFTSDNIMNFGAPFVIAFGAGVFAFTIVKRKI